jgi:hypothetical protein
MSSTRYESLSFGAISMCRTVEVVSMMKRPSQTPTSVSRVSGGYISTVDLLVCAIVNRIAAIIVARFMT